MVFGWHYFIWSWENDIRTTQWRIMKTVLHVHVDCTVWREMILNIWYVLTKNGGFKRELQSLAKRYQKTYTIS